MDRIISIVFAIFAVMFTVATAQAKPGLPSEAELIRVDCTTGTQCVQLNTGRYQTIEELIARESIQATPELAALTTDAATGIAFNLSSGAVAVRGYLPGGGFEVIWPPDYSVDKVEQLRKLASARRWTREEFGLSERGRARGAKFVVAKEIPLAQRLWLAGPEAIATHLEQISVSAPASAASAEETADLRAVIGQQGRELTELRHAIADCSGRVKLNDSGALVCVAVSGSISTGEILFLTIAAMLAALVLWVMWLKWNDTRGSLRLAQEAHNALRTLYDALRVQVDRAKELLHAGDQETVDNAADAIRRGVLVALGVDYREVPRDTDIVKAVSGKVAQLKDKYHELAAQIRRARGVFRAAEDVDLAQAAQTRMDELTTERKERAALISKVGEALGELNAHEADVGEIALHARRAMEEINRLGAELAYAQRASEQAQAERDRAAEEAKQATVRTRDLEQRAAEARASAEVSSQLASRTQAELSGLRGRVNGFAAVTEKIATSLDGAEYVYQHPYARPRRKKDGQMVVSPQREQFGQLISALRGVFPAQPPEPKPPRARRDKKAVSAQVAAPA